MELGQVNSKISFTCDVWTSKSQLPFIRVTAHYVNDDWQLVKKIVGFEYVEGGYSGEALARFFTNTIKQFGLSHKVLAITTDNATNNDTMVAALQRGDIDKDSAFQKEWCHVRCQAHVFNLVANEVIKKGQEATGVPNSGVSKISTMVRKIRKSPKQIASFKTICGDLKLTPRVPIVDVAMRWNSTYQMLEMAVRYKDVFMLLAIRNKWTDILLTEEDWNEVGDILEVLEPFQELTLQCSASSQLTINQALQRYECADSHLEEWLVKFSGTAFHDGLDRAVDKLQLYYDRASAVENIAVALDPRYKLKFMKEFAGVDRQRDEHVEGSVRALSQYICSQQCSTASRKCEEHCLRKNEHSLRHERNEKFGIVIIS